MNTGKKRRKAVVDQKTCVACGCCVKVCPLQAIGNSQGDYGSGKSGKMCRMWKMCKGMSGQRDLHFGGVRMKKKHWYDYLWIVSLTYLVLGFFHILFAWLGLLCFFIPLIISVVKGTKGYCNRYCGRGNYSACWVDVLDSPAKDIPKWMKSKVFRYGFLIFFFIMFFFDALKYLFCVCRSEGFETGGYTAVDIQVAMALGLSWNTVP